MHRTRIHVMLTPREHELLRHHRLNLQLELRALDAGELWHVLPDREYRSLVLAGLEEIELAGEEPPWQLEDKEADW